MIQARLIRLLLRVFAFFPLRVTHRIGAVMGGLLMLIPNELRRVSAANIALCFPGAAPAWRRKLLVRSLIESGKTAAELGPLWLWPGHRVHGLIRRVRGREYLNALLERNKGVILLIPHLGAWELVAFYISIHFAGRYPLTGLYRPPRIAELEPMLRRARERFGARFVPTTVSGVRALYRTLDRGGIIGVLPDQEPGIGKRVFAPFFGIPANTMGLVSRLMARTGAEAIYVYINRLPAGSGFEAHFLPAPPGIGDTDVVSAAVKLNQGVEACIRQQPEQYQWGYKRFRTRPPGMPDCY